VGGPGSQSVEQDIAVVARKVLEFAQYDLYDAVRDFGVGERGHGQWGPVEDSHRICCCRRRQSGSGQFEGQVDAVGIVVRRTHADAARRVTPDQVDKPVDTVLANRDDADTQAQQLLPG